MAQKDPTTPWTPPSDAILVEEKSTWTPPSDAILVDPTPEKKNVVGASQPAPLRGLGGSSDGSVPSPLSPQEIQQKSSIGVGALDRATKQKPITEFPTKGLEVPKEAIVGIGGTKKLKEGEWKSTELPKEEEVQFRDFMTNDPNVIAWAEEFKSNYGEYPSIDGGGYDYRGAWKAGQTPTPVNVDGKTEYHWGSIGENGKELKSPDHTTRWKSDYMQVTGKNPDEEGVSEASAKGAIKGANLANNVISKALNPPADIGQSFIDGKLVPNAKMRQYAQDRDFMKSFVAGEREVDIQGNPELLGYVEKQSNAIKNGSDWYDSLKAGVLDVKKNVQGLGVWTNDVLSEVTGVPNFLEVIASGATKKAQIGELQKSLAKSYEQLDSVENDIFEVDGQMTDLFSKGEYGEMGNLAVNTAARSLPNSLLIATAGALSGGTGAGAVMAGGAISTPVFIGGAYADQERDPKAAGVEGLSKFNRMITRPIAYGSAEAAGETLSLAILKGSTKIAMGSLRSTVGKVAQTAGKEAAEQVAESGARTITNDLLDVFIKNPAMEGVSELGTFVQQKFTDKVLGINNESTQKILKDGINTWALGAASGGVTTAPQMAVTAISSANTARKKFVDYTIKNDPEGLTSLQEAIKENPEQYSTTEQDLKVREKAVNAVPDNLVEDTEVVDDVQKKQELEEKKRNLDPVFAKPIEEEIAKIDERLAEAASKPKTTTPIEPVVFSTPTDERYARVNDNDGTQGGTRDLTKQEYLDWQAKNKPVTEQLTTSKTEQNAKEQQSEQMREQGVQEQPQGESDSNMPIVNQTELQDGKAPKEEVVGVGGGVESRRNKQLEIINKTNPAPNNYNTWIRKVEDIKTADEVFGVAKKEGAMYPDFTEEQMQDALDSGEITIYSSNSIENGVFVTPSKMNAQEYAGGKGGKLYSKKVKLEDIAWIDESEGQYAVVEQPQENKPTPAESTKEAPKEPVSESELNKKKADIEKRREAELSANKKLSEVSGGALSGESQLANEINAKYDAELAALEKPTKPFISSFGTPVKDLGKTLEGVSQTNLDGVNVLMSEVDENTVKLDSIETPKGKRNKGKAKAALQKIIDKADELGKTITLSVVPKKLEALESVKATTEALDGINTLEVNSKIGPYLPKTNTIDDARYKNSKEFSKAYHKAKKDGSNPELVKAVETLLGATTEEGLRKLYEGFGFVATEGKNMERVPNAEVKETKAEVTPETYKTESAKGIGTNKDIEFVKIGNSYIDAEIVKGEAVSGLPVSELKNKKIIQQKLKDLYDDRSLEEGTVVKELDDAIKFLESFLIQDEISEIETPKAKEETPTTIESIEKKDETDLILSGEAQKRRDDGEYERDGIVFKRNEEIKGDAGDKGVVRFAKNVEVPFTYKLVEAQSVQPSHQDGIRNPLHFIWEAQPKPRNDQGSIAAEDGFADNPRIKELGANTNAYSGAPVVNSRGEVIQGNNRAAGLRKGYNRGNQAYKNDLAKNADKFGLTEEQVLKMKNPILVRQVGATDALAIELGNYTNGDLETGSDSGINPVETARKIPATKRRAITEMLFRLDENGVIPTLNEAMRNNYEALKKLLADHLNTAQNNTIRKTSTPSPKALMELEGLIRQFLFEGGDPKISELFASLTSNQKNSIDKSLPSLFSVSPENSLISEVQNAILALSSFQSSGSESFNAWEKQSDVFNNNKTPRDVFTPTELYIAKLIAESSNTTDLRTKLTQYTEDVNGVEGGMFNDPIKPISKEDAIAKNFVKKTDSANKPGGNDAPIKKEGAPKPRTSKRTPKPVPPKVEPAKTDIDKRLEALKGETSKKADLAAEIAALKKSLWEDLNKQGFAQTPKQKGKDDAEFTNKLIQLAKLSIQEGLLSVSDFIKEALANYTGYRSKEEVTQMASDAFNEAKSEFDGNPPKKKRKSSSEMAKERKATSENEPKKQKKKAVVNRGVEGITSEEIKDALENTGLLYIVESHKEAAEIADDFIQRVGFDAALQSVRSETSGLTGAPKAILWGRLIDQVQETLDMETDPIEIVKMRSYIATLVDEFGIEAKIAGQYSSAMQWVYANSIFGYSLESQKSRYKAANNGVIEPAVQELFEQYDKQLKDVKKELIDVYEKLKEANEKAAFENLKNDLELDGEVSMPKPKMTAEARRKADKAIAVVRDIRTRIKANNYSDAVGITAAIDFGLGVIENGIEAGISVAEAIENGIAAIDNLMKDAPWKKDAFRKDVTKEFAKNNINTSSPKKKGQDPSDKGPTGIPRELLYALIKEEGINNIEDLTNAVMEELEIENTEENHRKTRDKITNYGKTRVATEGVAAELAKMTEIGRLISAIEDVQSGKHSKKSGFQREAPSQKVRDMRRQLRELTKNLPLDDHDTAKYHKTALDAIKTRLNNKIADLSAEIAAREKSVAPSKRTVEYDAEANELIEQIKILQIAHDEIFQKGVMSDEQRIELAITKLENAEKKFQHNIDVKNFTPPTREPEPDDPRVVAAREKMEAKKKEFKEAQIASGEVDSPEVIALERKVEAKKKAIQNLREKLFTGKIQPTTRTATGLVSQELIDLQKEHKDYLDQLNRARQAAKPRRSPEVIATENAVKSAERQLREIEDRIFNNQLDDIAKQSKVVQTAQLQFAKQKLADRKAFLRELQEQAGIPEKKRLEALKEAAKNRIAVMQERMRTSQYEKGKYKVKNGVVGAFTPLEKKKSPIDQELQDLLIKEMKIKEAYDVEVYRAELKNRSWPKKILDIAVEVSGLTRAVMATGEMSGVLIQGGKMLASHPQMTSRAIAEMFKQFASAKRAEDFINAVKSSEMYPELKAVKLAITDATQEGKLLAAEETFVGGYVRHLWNAIGFPLKAIPGKPKLFTPYDWAKAGLTGNYVEPQSAYERWEKLNPNEAFSRAQSGLLNYVRLSRYTQGRNMLIAQGKTFESHPEEYKDIAAYVNRATGRGGLGIAEPLAKPLSILLFSARNWASVMADVTPLVAYHYAKTGTSKNPFKRSVTQKMFMWDYLTWLGATSSLVGLYMIASGDDEEDDRPKVELDPRSSNFMKMRVGNTYIDVFSGRQQMVVFQSRMLSNSIKNGTSNKVYNLGQSAYTPTRGRLAWNLWKGKSNPSAGMFYKWLEKSTNQEGVDTDEFGQPYDATQNLIDNAYPMYWGTISELYEEQPDLVATALTGAAFFGLGAQTYGQNIGPVERAYLKIENEKRDKVTAVNEETSKKIDKEFDGQFITKNNILKYELDYLTQYRESLGESPKKGDKTDVFNSIIEKHNAEVFKQSASKELIGVSMNMGKASMRKPELIAKKLIDAEMYPMDENTKKLLKGALTVSEYQKMNSTLMEYANWKASQKQAANKKSLSSSLTISLKSIFSN